MAHVTAHTAFYFFWPNCRSLGTSELSPVRLLLTPPAYDCPQTTFTVPNKPSEWTYRKHVTWSLSTVVWRHCLLGSVFAEPLLRNGLCNPVLPQLLDAGDIENTALSIVACWTVFTELLSRNAMIKLLQYVAVSSPECKAKSWHIASIRFENVA
jgi:hypothetical protein